MAQNPKKKQAEVAEAKRDKRWGIRIAQNGSAITGDKDTGMGYGFTIGPVISFPLRNTIDILTELNFIYRKPMDYELIERIVGSGYKLKIIETAIGANFLFRSLPFGGPVFYLEGGFQLDIPLSTKVRFFDISRDLKTRAGFDFGLAFGLGWNIGEHFALGLRCIGYFTDFDKDADGNLIQSEIGLSYMF